MESGESIQFIMSRRSIRQFTTQPITEGELQALLDAAMAAPSASDLRPWHFVVVTDRPTLSRLADGHPHAKMLKQAPLAVAVCGDPHISDAYWVQDCSAAVENLLLAAVGLGLGSVWLGVHPRAERKSVVRKELGIPQAIEPLALVAIGHPKETKEPHTKFDPERVHSNHW
jgi:nitroreductase